MKSLILSIIVFTYLPVFCQFNIPSPIINVGNYTITDTVYMDPQGSDANLGTFSSPLQTFAAAVQMLPWGTAGINGGHAYGLIMLKPGFYQTTLGFQQYANNWQNNGVYKDISVEGIGNVIIGGTAANLSTGHLLQLSGDHIFVKNITLQYSSGTGLLISRINPRQRNILIDNVTVEHVGAFSILSPLGAFSILTKAVDTISIINSKSLYASRIGFENVTSHCEWPSGIKLLDNSNCIVNNCEVAYTRGEGLNFQNSTLCNAYSNHLQCNLEPVQQPMLVPLNISLIAPILDSTILLRLLRNRSYFLILALVAVALGFLIYHKIKLYRMSYIIPWAWRF